MLKKCEGDGGMVAVGERKGRDGDQYQMTRTVVQTGGVVVVVVVVGGR